jgi:aryl-alcohol dehydrogenase-like predicted oxidoreductase
MIMRSRPVNVFCGDLLAACLGMIPFPAMNTIAQRTLGNSGERVSAVGFGCMGLVGWYGTRNDEESRATLLAAIDRGVTHFDTAASYQVGENERFVGKVLQPFRKRIFLASKCGLTRGPDGSTRVDNRPETIRRSLDESLGRLGFDAIDLFYLHRIDRGVPIEDSVGTLADLVKAGKIRHVGLSECSIATLRRAAAVHPVAAVQSEYSIWSRDPEQGLLGACRELGAGFVAYSPLGRGFLAGNFRRLADLPATDNRRTHPRFQDANAAQNERLVALLQDIAAASGASAAQVAIAWVLSRAHEVVTIPGMKTRAHLADNLAGGELQLAPAQLQRIDDLLAASPVAGERHPPAMMQILDRD